MTQNPEKPVSQIPTKKFGRHSAKGSGSQILAELFGGHSANSQILAELFGRHSAKPGFYWELDMSTLNKTLFSQILAELFGGHSAKMGFYWGWTYPTRLKWTTYEQPPECSLYAPIFVYVSALICYWKAMNNPPNAPGQLHKVATLWGSNPWKLLRENFGRSFLKWGSWPEFWVQNE